MPEPTCSYRHQHETVRCGAPGVIDCDLHGWRCQAHARLAPGHYLLGDGDILNIVGMAVAVAENECRTGHNVKQDEVALNVWRQVITHLNSKQEREAVQ